MAHLVPQQLYESLCRRFGVDTDCHVELVSLSRKQVKRRLKELAARMQLQVKEAAVVEEAPIAATPATVHQEEEAVAVKEEEEQQPRSSPESCGSPLDRLTPQVRECVVECERLDGDFVAKAQQGLVCWSAYFADPEREVARLAHVASEPAYVEEEEDDAGRLLHESTEEEEEEEEGSDFEEEEEEAKRKKKGKKESRKEGGGSSGGRRRGTRVTRRVLLHKCRDCSFSCSSLRELKRHAAKHSGLLALDAILCPTCGAHSYSTADDERHQYESHEGPTKLPRLLILFCKSCRQFFDGEKEFDHHIVNHVV